MILTPEQEKIIETELRDKDKASILIVYVPTDESSGKLCFTLSQLLGRVGWTVEERDWREILYQRPVTPEDDPQGFEGFFVGVPELAFMPPTGALDLLAALKKAKVPIADEVQAFPHDPQKRCCLAIGGPPTSWW